MGSFDGAEICKLVDLFVLNKLAEEFGKEYVGLYLVLIEGVNRRNADNARKIL
jgi:hypothetical protein